MKTRPVATFTAAARGTSVRVRVLPSVADVDAEACGSLPRIGHRIRHALFRPRELAHPAFRDTPGIAGTIILPADGALLELVPHEVTHAVMHDLRAATHVNDEELATTVGLLSAAIFTGLHKRGIGVTPW